MNMFRIIKEALRITFDKKSRRVTATGLWVLIFVGLFLFPVVTIPGNDVRFQSSLFGLQDYIVLIIISFLAAISLTLQIEVFRENRASGIAHGATGFLSSFMIGLFGTASCTACLGALVSLLGASYLATLIEYRLLIVSVSLLLLFISTYLSSHRIVKGCKDCKIPGVIE